MKVFVFIAEGFEEIEAITIVDILRRAEFDVKTVSISKGMVVTGASGIAISADILFDEELIKAGDMLVLPGGMPGTENLASHSGLASLLKSYADENKWIAAICAAPMVLGKLGLLKGKAATSYPGFESDLIGADYKTERVVVDGRIITSRGPGTAMEFSLKLVEVLGGKELSGNLKSDIVG